jgi:hypothetical protein
VRAENECGVLLGNCVCHDCLLVCGALQPILRVGGCNVETTG